MRHNERLANALAGLFCFSCVFSILTSASGTQSLEAGVKHRIDAIVSIQPESSLLRPSRELTGTITFFVRISANSRESRYFGVLSPTFSNVIASEKKGELVPQTKVWEEDLCHQRRGLPKVTVTQIKGIFGAEQDKVEVNSAVRRIGLHVPPDELTPGIKISNGRDDVGSYYAIRARTRDSRIQVDLKIYAFNCVLPN